MKRTKHASSVGVKLIGTYGTSTVIGFNHPYRIEEYTPHDEPNRCITEHTFAVDAYDSTPHHSIGKGYDNRCGTCYLGYAHTEAYHTQNIAKHEAQSAKAKAEHEQHTQWKAVNL